MLSMLFKAGLDATAIERGASAAAKKAGGAFAAMGKEVSNRITGIFAAGYILNQLTSWVTKTVDWADSLGDAADNLGISVEEVQRFEAAAQLAGARVSKMKSALEAVAALQTQAEGGDKRAQGIFGILGINPAGKNPLELMKEITTEAQKGGVKLAAAGDIFGKKMQGVANTISKMGEVENMKVASQNTIDEIGNAVDQMNAGIKSLMVDSANIIVSVLRSIGAYAEGIGKSIAAVKEGGVKAFGWEFLMSNWINRATDAYMRMEQTPITPSSGVNPPPPPPDIAGSKSNPLALQSDALSRVGLFVGGRGDAANQLVTIGNYQLSELRAIRAELQHANR